MTKVWNDDFPRNRVRDRIADERLKNARAKALADFTRVVEETGVLDQQRPQKEKSRDE